MKKIYISHEFGGIYDNAKEIVDYIKQLISINRNAVYISPVLLYGCVYDTLPYQVSMDYCTEILKDCDMMITFGDKSNSTGCMLEKEFCRLNNIKVIDFEDYRKLYE